MDSCPIDIVKVIISRIDNESILAVAFSCKTLHNMLHTLYSDVLPVTTFGRVFEKYGAEYCIDVLGKKFNEDLIKIYKHPCTILSRGDMWEKLDNKVLAKILIDKHHTYLIKNVSIWSKNEMIKSNLLYAITRGGLHTITQKLLEKYNAILFTKGSHKFRFMSAFIKQRLWQVSQWKTLLLGSFGFLTPYDIALIYDVESKYPTFENVIDIYNHIAFKGMPFSEPDKYLIMQFVLVAIHRNDRAIAERLWKHAINSGLKEKKMIDYCKDVIDCTYLDLNISIYDRCFANDKFADIFSAAQMWIDNWRNNKKIKINHIYKLLSFIQAENREFMPCFASLVINNINYVIKEIMINGSCYLIDYGIKYGYLDAVKSDLILAMGGSKYELQKRLRDI